MHVIDTEIEIGATQERVWSILTDFDAYPRWNPFIRAIAGAPRQGAVLEVRIEPRDAAASTFRPTVLVAARPRELCWRGRLLIPGIFDGMHRFAIEPLSDERVRFRQTEKFGGLLVPFLRRKLDGPIKRGFVEMNAALKQHAEASARSNRSGAATFDRDAQCAITKVVGADSAGRATFGERIDEPCSVVRFMGREFDAEAGIRNAPQFPTSPERLADAVILLRITTRAAVGDMIEVAGVKLKVIGISQNYDSVGKISNHIAEAVIWM